MAGWKLTLDPDRFHGLSLFCPSIAFLIHYFAFMLKRRPPSSPSLFTLAGKASPCFTWIPRVCNQYHCFSKTEGAGVEGLRRGNKRMRRRKSGQKEKRTKNIEEDRQKTAYNRPFWRYFVSINKWISEKSVGFWWFNSTCQNVFSCAMEGGQKEVTEVRAKRQKSSWFHSEKEEAQMRREKRRREKEKMKWRQGLSGEGGLS